MSLLRRPPIFSFSAGQLPDMLFSLAVGRSTLSLCRPCSSCREIHGVGSRSAPKQTSRERRMAKNELLRRNRRNPELEKAARTLTRKDAFSTTSVCNKCYLRCSTKSSITIIIVSSVSSSGRGPGWVAAARRSGAAANCRHSLQPLPGRVRQTIPSARVHGGHLWQQGRPQRDHPNPLWGELHVCMYSWTTTHLGGRGSICPPPPPLKVSVLPLVNFVGSKASQKRPPRNA